MGVECVDRLSSEEDTFGGHGCSREALWGHHDLLAPICWCQLCGSPVLSDPMPPQLAQLAYNGYSVNYFMSFTPVLGL